MKRSEMLQIITEVIYMDGKFEDNEIVDAESLASDVLFHIEREGMLPPKYSACIITREPKERGELDVYDWEKE